MLRWMTAGESHGEALTALIEGVPAGVEITTDTIRAALARRRLGHGRGARQAFEADEVSVLGGIRHGRTMGGPVAILIRNSEWPAWSTVMSADPVDPADLLVDAGTGDEREIARNRPLTRPRPGHADLAGMLKYDLPEARPVLERASNLAGGIEGGMSNGSDVVVRAAYKPISTVPRALRTVDLATGGAATALHQRSETPAVVPGAGLAEGMFARALAHARTDQTGGGRVAAVHPTSAPHVL